ncbi:MAG TPA: hypothetical protein VHZ73_10305 [Vicinamibacterales bacterium]|jgi:hypothetical protein|nr:hypothetical protein [Vicinamibacterales bacterium]
MHEWTQRLRDADPLAWEPELSAFDVAIVRQRVIAISREPHETHASAWQAAVVLAAVAALAVAGTLFDSRHARSIDRAPVKVASEATATIRMRTPTTQVQFQTPGGTRIVWTINPDLNF